jgi:hypothetical protein
MRRRTAASRLLHGLVALFGAAVLPAGADTPPPPPLAPPKVLGIFSLLGDSLQVVQATDAPADTRIERQARENLDVKGLSLDSVALKQANLRAAQVWPQARIEMFRSNEALTVPAQRAVADGAQRAELPDWMVRTIEAKKLTHLLIITRDQGDVNVRTAEGNTVGRGKSQGVGFYLDTLYEMRNITTGEMSSGLMAGYVHLRLTLMDADSGEVLRRYDVHDSRAVAPNAKSTGLDPWTYLSTADKVKMLRNLVEIGMDRAMADIVK